MRKGGSALILRFVNDSNPENRKHTRFCLFLLGLLCAFLPLRSAPQSLSPPPVISGVSIVVDGQASGEDLERLIPIKKGDSFSLKRINSSIKQVYRTGLFSEIQVVKEGDQEIHLTFFLTRKLFARRIIFQGEQKLPRLKLKEGLLSLREGSFFTEMKLEKAVGELNNALTQEGYFFPDIESYTKRDPKSASFDVFFRISSFRKFLIKEINFTGELIVPEDDLKKAIKSKEGKVYVPSVLEEDLTRIKELYNSIEHQRAEIAVEDVRFDEQEGTVSLLFHIVPNEKIEIVVHGADVPLKLLRPIWEARVFEDWGLKEGRARILEHLRKKGFLFASVQPSIEKENNMMRVVYAVTPNKKYKILKVSYEGLNYFSPSQLEAELGAGEGIPFLEWIDGESLYDLPEEMKYLYRTRGFPDAQVDFFFRKKNRGVDITFQIQEGNQHTIRSLSFEGARLFGTSVLLSQIDSVEGGPFFQLNIQKDIEKLESFYLDQGIRGTEIVARIESVGEDIFSVVFRINEGEKVKIEKIVITGNVATHRKTILRELRIKEGDDARSDRIRESKRRLERLGIFTQVRIEEIPLNPERENLVINIREGKRNYAGFGLGMETATKPQSSALWESDFRLRGLVEFIRSNVFGSAGQVSLIGQVSLREKRAVLSWEQPYFFGLALQTHVNAWAERESRESFAYDRQGVSLTTIRPLSEKAMFLATLMWAETTLVNLQIEPNEVDRQFFPYSATSISGSFIWDRRNDPFNPERGSFFSCAVERAFPLLEEESDYMKTFIKFQQYVPLLSGTTFSLTSRLGLGGGKRDIPIHERFFAGGSNSFRGERFDELGPVDEDSLKPIGGESLLLLNLELTFPLFLSSKNLKAAVFYDVGNVFEKGDDLSLKSLKNAVGFGIRYRTPLGPVRLELAWNMNVPEAQRDALFFITIGNVF